MPRKKTRWKKGVFTHFYRVSLLLEIAPILKPGGTEVNPNFHGAGPPRLKFPLFPISSNDSNATTENEPEGLYFTYTSYAITRPVDNITD